VEICNGWVKEEVDAYENAWTSKKKLKIASHLRDPSVVLAKVDFFLHPNLDEEVMLMKKRHPSYLIKGVKSQFLSKAEIDFGYFYLSKAIGLTSVKDRLKNEFVSSLKADPAAAEISFKIFEWDFLCDLFTDEFRWEVALEIEAEDRVVIDELMSKTQAQQIFAHIRSLSKALSQEGQSEDRTQLLSSLVLEETLSKMTFSKPLSKIELSRVYQSYFDANSSPRIDIDADQVVLETGSREVFPVSTNKAIQVNKNNVQWTYGGE